MISLFFAILIWHILVYAYGFYFGVRAGKRLEFEKGFIVGHEAGQLDMIDKTPYVMPVEENK